MNSKEKSIKCLFAAFWMLVGAVLTWLGTLIP